MSALPDDHYREANAVLYAHAKEMIQALPAGLGWWRADAWARAATTIEQNETADADDRVIAAFMRVLEGLQRRVEEDRE